VEWSTHIGNLSRGFMSIPAETFPSLEYLCKQIKKYSKSIKTTIINRDMVKVEPPFQQPFYVISYSQFMEKVAEGWVALPDDETCFGEGS
jgi:hypothetical protein